LLSPDPSSDCLSGNGGSSINTLTEANRDFQRDEDSAPVDMLAALFEARGWPCQFIAEDEISAEIKGSWTAYEVRGVWRREDHVLQLLCLPDIRVPDTKRTAIYELLALVNEQLWVGHFDLWSNGNVLVYRHGLLLGDEGLMSLDQAQVAVEAAIEECDRFYPAFQFVLWSDKTASEALASSLVDAAGEA